jgi:hypothetical protein
MADATENLGAVSAAAFKEQTTGVNEFGNDWNKFVSKMKVTGIKLGEKLFPVVEKLLNALDPILDKILAMDDATLEWGIKAAGLAMALGPVLRGLGGITSLLSNNMGLFTSSITDFAGMAGGLDSVASGATGAAGKVSKFAKVLGGLRAAGAVVGAGAAGYAIGETFNQLLFDPQVKESTEKRESFDVVRRQALDVARTGTREEKLAAFAKLGETRRAAEATGDIANIEDVAGTLVSAFSDIESPMERHRRQIREIIDAQEKLVKSLDKENAIRRSAINTQTEVIENRQVTKEIVELNFKNIPDGTKVTRTKSRPVPNTGVTMAGVF